MPTTNVMFNCCRYFGGVDELSKCAQVTGPTGARKSKWKRKESTSSLGPASSIAELARQKHLSVSMIYYHSLMARYLPISHQFKLQKEGGVRKVAPVRNTQS
ncbi:hypothetical protein EPI10_005033 [Gossypium australe]|uniref:Uncharacterized protein n=1 Tax=Gossypium australe TaxID=47621 RepID=A0A5B6WP88_9ROSI|nr:hypothetical protein EPI10_005033 [Gossypium australe]